MHVCTGPKPIKIFKRGFYGTNAILKCVDLLKKNKLPIRVLKNGYSVNFTLQLLGPGGLVGF